MPQNVNYKKNHINMEEKKQSLIPSAEIVKKLENTQLLLGYITDNGKDINKEWVTTLVNARYRLENNLWDVETEVDFLMAYREVTNLIMPVTIDSLVAQRTNKIAQLSNSPNTAKKALLTWLTPGSFSLKSVSIYSVCTVIFMAVLLTLQIFFCLGSTRLSDIQISEEKLIQKNKRLQELNLMLNTGSEDNSLKVYEIERDEIKDELGRINKEIESDIRLLVPWVTKVRKFSFNIQSIKTEKNEEAKNYSLKNNSYIQEAKSYQIIIGIYILPLLYGLVGGFTFVLRELNSEIKNLTFTSSDNTKYLLRILLGAIAGLSIGLFWGDIEKTESLGLASLSPMLLAFIAGYCVEYVFIFIENIVLGFINRTNPNNKKQQEETSINS